MGASPAAHCPHSTQQLSSQLGDLQLHFSRKHRCRSIWGAWVTSGTKAWRWQGQKRGVDTLQVLCALALRGAPGDSLAACTRCTENTAGECLGFTQSKPHYPEQAWEPALEEKMTASAGIGQVSPWIQHLLFMVQNKLHYFC